MTGRASIPRDIERTVLTECRRRCALCFYLDFDFSIKQGQIAHLDRDPANNEKSNLVFLCLTHHDQYDSKPSQSKGMIKGEIEAAKSELEKFLHSKSTSLISGASTRGISIDPTSTRISTDLYRLRLPIYHAFLEFVGRICAEAATDPGVILEFGRKTHESIFLFGEEMDRFLRDVGEKAWQLRVLQRKMGSQRPYNENEWHGMVEEEGKILLWFGKQAEQARSTFAKYLTVGVSGPAEPQGRPQATRTPATLPLRRARKRLAIPRPRAGR